jgi:L-malate glycosyltransferase
MTLIRALPFGIRGNQDVSQAALPHVLLVVDQFSETFGGGERIALKLAALLPIYGYRVSILTFFVHPRCIELESAPCPIYVLPLQRTYDLSAFRAALALRHFLKLERIVIVQTFFESSDLWAGLVTKLMSDAKLIWSRRDMGILRGRKHDIAYKLMSGTPDAVFAVSEQVRQHGITVDGIPSNRVLTIYNGLDVEGWSAPRREIGDGKFVVATLGNIRKVKGHDVFIRAAASVVRAFPNVSFMIAGEVLEPDYFKELRELVRDLNLTDHFTFRSGVTDIREYLSAVDVFVLPSRSEGFSNAIIEAMAASLPVVATDVGGNAEAIKDGVSGFIIPSEDDAALSDAITRFLSDPSKAKEMGVAGRGLVVEKFTIAAMMQQITNVYSSLLEDRTLSRAGL